MTDNPQNFLFEEPLHNFDLEADRFLRLERRRQQDHIILVASESIAPKPVRDVLSHVFTNIYAEGYPSTRMSVWERENIDDYERHLAFFRRYADRRYYKGTELADFIETLAQKRAAEMFTQYNENGVRADDVFVNVQPLSGAAANNAIYNAFVKPGDTVMGIQLEQGGHLSHGSPVNRSGMNHNIISYGVDPKTGKLDYDQMIDLARKYKPKMIIGGASAYPWAIDWRAMREAADAAGAILLADIAHPAGLVVAGFYPNPVGIADVVTTTTHKTLCGPRGAIALTTNPEYAKLIDLGVFPGEQGGPHINSIAAKAVAFGIAQTPQFRELQRRIKDYALLMSERFKEKGFKIAYGGTDSHLFLLDLKGIPGKKQEFNADIASRVLDLVNITSNKNTIAGDESAANPTGFRIGTTWLAQLGFTPEDAIELTDIIADTLSDAEPFKVLGAFGDLGRGKLPLDTLINARERVAKLLAKHPWNEVEKTKAEDEYFILGNEMPFPLATLAGANEWQETFVDAETDKKQLDEVAISVLENEGLLEVTGERAYIMLDQLCSADINGLNIGGRIETFFFENSGKVIADAWVYRLPDTEEGFGRFWIRVSKERKDRLYTWLQAHNDGYVLFEDSDLYAKIDGPVSIKDLRARSKNRMFCYALMGKNAVEAMGKLCPGVTAEHIVAEAEHDGRKVAVLQYTFGGQPVVEVYTDYLHAPETASRIKELFTEKAFVGYGVYDLLRATEGLDYAELGKTCQGKCFEKFYAKFPERFNITKPYFTGQKKTVELVENLMPVGEEFKWEEKEGDLKRSCLYDEHVKLKGRLVPFAGWEMPVMYTSILDEHVKVRTGAGLFDVSHMGVFEFEGEDAENYLDLVTSNFVKRLRPGNSHYSYIFDANGDCIDDIMVYRIGQKKFQMVVNAANEDKDWEWFNGVLEGRYKVDNARPWVKIPNRLAIRNLKTDESLGDRQKIDIALQGRNSLKILQSMTNSHELKQKLEWLPKTDFMDLELDGIPTTVARTGYTGEPVGFELYLHPANATALWNAILSRVDTYPVYPVGLGARDSTRTEAGFPLYGHELAGPHNIFPTEAGYGSFVKRHKPFFLGRAPFLAKEANQKNELIRFKVDKKGISTIHPGAPVLNKKGQCIGYVTSAALIGTKQMGLALVGQRYTKVGTPISIIIPPRKGAKAMNPVEIKPGESMILPEPAKILDRFPTEEEMMENLED